MGRPRLLAGGDGETGLLREVGERRAGGVGGRVARMRGEALADQFLRLVRVADPRQRLQQFARFVRVAAVRIARDVELDEGPHAAALRQIPERVLLDRIARRGAARYARVGQRGEELAGVRPMLALGIAIEIDAQERGIAGAGGELPELSLGRGRRRGTGREGELPGERGILPGHLIAAGRGEHVLAHRDHHRGDVLAARRQVAQDRLRERRVPSAAVEGDVVRLGREGDQEPGCVADPGEPVLEPREVRLAGERIVAAGVEEDEMDALAALELLDQAAQVDRLAHDVVGRSQGGVDRHEVVLRRELEAVAGIVEERDIRLAGLADEARDEALHPRLVEIGAGDDLEAEALEGAGDVARVVARIGQRLQFPVAAVADDEGDPLLRLRHAGAEDDERRKKGRRREPPQARPRNGPSAHQSEGAPKKAPEGAFEGMRVRNPRPSQASSRPVTGRRRCLEDKAGKAPCLAPQGAGHATVWTPAQPDPQLGSGRQTVWPRWPSSFVRSTSHQIRTPSFLKASQKT